MELEKQMLLSLCNNE